MPRFDNAPSELNKLLEQAYGQCLEQRNSATEKDCTVCEQIALDLAKKYGWTLNDQTGMWEKAGPIPTATVGIKEATATERTGPSTVSR